MQQLQTKRKMTEEQLSRFPDIFGFGAGYRGVLVSASAWGPENHTFWSFCSALTAHRPPSPRKSTKSSRKAMARRQGTLGVLILPRARNRPSLSDHLSRPLRPWRNESLTVSTPVYWFALSWFLGVRFPCNSQPNTFLGRPARFRTPPSCLQYQRE